MEWGGRPRGMLGHSLGGFVGACVAGVLTLPDALHLVAARGRIMGEMPPGGMLSVARPADEVAALLGELPGGGIALGAAGGGAAARPPIAAAPVAGVGGGGRAGGGGAPPRAERGIESRPLRTS